jgi:hypothetical protein
VTTFLLNNRALQDFILVWLFIAEPELSGFVGFASSLEVAAAVYIMVYQKNHSLESVIHEAKVKSEPLSLCLALPGATLIWTENHS